MTLRLSSTALLCLLASVSLAGCGSPEEKRLAYLKHGNDLFKQGQFEKARLDYRNALKLKPTDVETIYRIGLVDDSEGNFREAFNAFTKAEQQDPRYHPAELKLAEYYLAGESFDESAKRINNVLADNPQNPDAHALQAGLYLHQRKLDQAEAEAKLALQEDANNIVAFSVLAGIYRAQDKYDSAVAAADEGLKRNPNTVSLALLRAQLDEPTGNFDRIERSYQALFQLTPQEPRYRVRLAQIYAKAQRFDDAERTLRDGIKAMPDSWDMKHELVGFLNNYRSPALAEQEIRLYMKAFPQAVEPETWLIDLYMRHQQMAQAESFIAETLNNHPTDQQRLEANLAQARIDLLRGDRQGAQNQTDAVLRQDQNNLNALFLKAHLEYENGNYDDAVADLRAVIRDRPRSPEALDLLAETFVVQSHLDLAIDTLNQLIEIDPLNPAAKVRLAQLYAENGDARHAMDLLFFVTKAEPDFAPAWEITARIAIDTKDWSTAELAIHKLDALPGQQTAARMLQGLLLAHSGKTAEALSAFDQVVASDPASAMADRAVAEIVGLEPGPLAAITYIEGLKTMTPAMRVLLGRAELAAGKPQEAAAAFDAALAAQPPQPDAYLERAKLYVRGQQTDKALALLEQASSQFTSDLRFPLMKAEIAAHSGNFNQAIAIYQAILQKNPGLDAVANNLAELIADNKSTDSATLAQAAQIAERFADSDNPAYLDTLGWIYYRQGRLQDAQALYERITSSNPKLSPQFHYHYGVLLLKAGQPAAAKTELQKAVAGDSYDGIADARRLLAAL